MKILVSGPSSPEIVLGKKERSSIPILTGYQCRLSSGKMINTTSMFVYRPDNAVRPIAHEERFLGSVPEMSRAVICMYTPLRRIRTQQARLLCDRSRREQKVNIKFDTEGKEPASGDLAWLQITE